MPVSGRPLFNDKDSPGSPQPFSDHLQPEFLLLIVAVVLVRGPASSVEDPVLAGGIHAGFEFAFLLFRLRFPKVCLTL
jgi:hypothetical protein